MARSVASRIWQQFFQDHPYDQCNGAKYRHECLSHGGGKPSRELVGDFLGRPVDVSDLCDALVNERDERQEISNKLTRKT